MTIAERMTRFRALMAEHGMDAYLVPTADFHASEFVGAHFQALAYLSGFVGSAGTLVITQEEAGLWTDGRYFLKAEQALAGTGIDLYRMGVEGTPEIPAFLDRVLPANGVVGADGRTITASHAVRLAQTLGEGRTLNFSEDLVDLLWTDRPPIQQSPIFVLDERYAGESAQAKLRWLRAEMARLGADGHLLTSSDQIAWLLNIRGGDIPCTPVALCYALIEPERARLFIDPEKVTEEAAAHLRALSVETAAYDTVVQALEEWRGACMLLDSERTNDRLYRIVHDRVRLLEQDSPILHRKARKNAVEQENLRRVHIKDGVALTKLLHWLKTGLDGQTVTECQVARRATELRAEQEGFISPSFGTLAACGPHGAIVPYEPTAETDVPLERHGFLLVDSGGQYYEGTTDVTRTIALGALTDEQKKHFTLTLQGMLNLAFSVFPEGCAGFHLDALAREPLWQAGIDFGHGTGHGIGYLLCVHEPPIGFSWRRTERYDTGVLHAGMGISDEPGVYIAGSHGLRIENQLLCVPAEHEGFLRFDILTLAPIDLDAIDLRWLDEKGRERLNRYHQRVYDTLSPYLPEEVRAWLAQATRAV